MAGEVMSDSPEPSDADSIIWPTCGSGLILDYRLSQRRNTLFEFLTPPLFGLLSGLKFGGFFHFSIRVQQFRRPIIILLLLRRHSASNSIIGNYFPATS